MEGSFLHGAWLSLVLTVYTDLARRAQCASERERERERERGGNSSEEKGVTQLGAPAPLSHSSTLTLFHSHTYYS